MKEPNGSREDRVVLGVQISMVICFYFFTAGVFAFLWYAVYRSVADNDHPVHALVMASVITLAFLILTSVVTMVFTAIIKEGSLVKSQFSPPLAGGDEGEGERTDGNTVTCHPHPNLPPSRGREVGIFYETVKEGRKKFPASGGSTDENESQ